MKKQYSFEDTLANIPLESSKSSRYPFMVEFTGTTEAGKTTCILEVKRKLEAKKLKVSYVCESAELVPEDIYPKGSFEAHLFLRLTTVISIIEESLKDDCDILLIDRGIVDGIFFTHKYIQDYPKWTKECEGLISMLESFNFLLPDISLIFSCSPNEVIKRRGGEGRLVTRKFIENYNKLLEETTFSPYVIRYKMDTTSSTPDEVASKATIIIKSEYQKSLRR